MSRLDLLVGRHDPAGYANGIGQAARFSHPDGAVAVGTMLYVADSGNNTVRAIDTTTGVVTTIAGSPWTYGNVDGPGEAAQFKWITGITSLGGLLYVVDADANVVRSVDPSTGEVKLFAGQYDTPGGSDGPALGATFDSPADLTSDGTDLFVVEFNGNRIRKIDMATGMVSLFAGGTDGDTDGVGAAAQFHYPWGIAYAGGILYVADLDNEAVRAIVATTAQVTTVAQVTDGGTVPAVAAVGQTVYFAHVGGLYTYTQVAGTTGLASSTWSIGTMDGDPTTALFRNPHGLTFSGGKVWVVDADNSSIRAVDASTQLTTTFAGNMEPTAGPVDGIGADARFDQLNGIGTDGTRVWVTDENNYTIREIDPVTKSSTLIAGQPMQYGTMDGQGSGATFHRPSGIAYDPDDGMLYDTDRDSHCLRRIDPTTHDVVTIGSAGDYDGPGDVIYANGTLYVADELGQRILAVDPATGAVTPIAGQQDTPGNQDGVGAAATFANPRGLSMCGGLLYVADRSNHSIRRVDPASGTVTTWVAGGVAQDGPIATARLGTPMGTACDADALYVADAGAHAVRKIDFATETVSTVVGTFNHAEDHDDVLANATTNTPLNVRLVGGHLVVLNQSNLRIIH